VGSGHAAPPNDAEVSGRASAAPPISPPPVFPLRCRCPPLPPPPSPLRILVVGSTQRDLFRWLWGHWLTPSRLARLVDMNVDGDGDDDRGGVSGRQACVLEKPPLSRLPAALLTALLFLSECPFYPSPSVSLEQRAGGAKPRVDSRGVPDSLVDSANVTNSS